MFETCVNNCIWKWRIFITFPRIDLFVFEWISFGQRILSFHICKGLPLTDFFYSFVNSVFLLFKAESIIYIYICKMQKDSIVFKDILSNWFCYISFKVWLKDPESAWPNHTYVNRYMLYKSVIGLKMYLWIKIKSFVKENSRVKEISNIVFSSKADFTPSTVKKYSCW